LLDLSAIAQDKPDPAAQAKPTTEDKASAPTEAEQAAALQKATQNPVANLISVPLQNNTAFNYGPFNRTQDVLNIQPVIPTHLGKNWMLFSRIIQPIVWQPYPIQNTGGEYGLSRGIGILAARVYDSLLKECPQTARAEVNTLWFIPWPFGRQSGPDRRNRFL
jgi:hypothetical protein